MKSRPKVCPLLLSGLVMLLLLTQAGCQALPAVQPGQPTVVTGVLTYPETADTSEPAAESYQPPQSVTVSINSAPKVGETAELTVRVNQNWATPVASRVTKTWLQFMYRNTEGTYHEYRNPVEVPVADVLLGSTADWVGDLQAGSPLEFTVPVKLAKLGLYDVAAYAELDSGVTVYDRLYLGTTAEKAGVQSSAGTFGQTDWMKDYHNYSGESHGTDQYRMDTSVDFASPPLLDKPCQLTWSVVSEYDAEEVTVSFYFIRWEFGKYTGVEVAGGSIRKDGILNWAGPLKKGVPATATATLVFPASGDWEVGIRCRDKKNNSTSGTEIFFSISGSGSRWGWAETHDAHSENPPPIPWGPEP